MVVGSEVPIAAGDTAGAGAPGGDASTKTGNGGTAAARPVPVTPVRRRAEGTIPSGMGVSPAAVKPRLHVQATEPSTIERDLSLSEVTYSLWQLKAQQESESDHQWFLQATKAMEHHASMLDRQAVSIMKLRADAAEAVSQTQVAVQQAADHHAEHQRAIELFGQTAAEQHTQLDAMLRDKWLRKSRG